MEGGDSRRVVGYGVVTSYLRSRARQYNRYLLVDIVNSVAPRVDNLVGLRAMVRGPRGDRYLGKIVRVHGKSGGSTVVVRMRRSIPGQLLGGRVVVLSA